MTLILAWLNEDSTAMHIASDSRLSDGANTWEYATKLFRMYPTDSVFAYTGDSLFALSLIAQATAVLHETDNLSNSNNGGRAPGLNARVAALKKHFESVMQAFPTDWGNGATVLCAGYDERNRRCALYEISVDQAGVQDQLVAMAPGQVRCYGSGSLTAENLLQQNPGRSIEDVLTVLKNVIDDPANDAVGGVPQMFTIRPDGTSAVGFNATVNGHQESTLFAIPLRFASKMSKVEFRGEDLAVDRYLRAGGVRRAMQADPCQRTANASPERSIPIASKR